MSSSSCISTSCICYQMSTPTFNTDLAIYIYTHHAPQEVVPLPKPRTHETHAKNTHLQGSQQQTACKYIHINRLMGAYPTQGIRAAVHLVPCCQEAEALSSDLVSRTLHISALIKLLRSIKSLIYIYRPPAYHQHIYTQTDRGMIF